jgi:hypothetical protein
MTKQSKALFLARLPIEIQDNTTGLVTPLNVRTVETNATDSSVWLVENNTLEGVNTFQGGTIDGLTVSIATTILLTNLNRVVLKPGVDTCNLPPIPSGGQWYSIKNRSGGDVTLNGNGNNLFTYLSVTTITIIAGAMIELFWDGEFWNIN